MGKALDAWTIQQKAAEGIQGSSAPLPHREHLQEAFGRHEIGDVRAHVDDSAKQATAAIGAEAYACGEDIAFRDEPSLHTAAHEAAHVIQQRGGVQLKGGVGQSGDRYEQHADAVADAVVAGQSAETLLDRFAGDGRVSHGGFAAQLQDSPDTTEVVKDDAAATPPAWTDAIEYNHGLGFGEAAQRRLRAAVGLSEAGGLDGAFCDALSAITGSGTLTKDALYQLPVEGSKDAASIIAWYAKSKDYHHSDTRKTDGEPQIAELVVEHLELGASEVSFDDEGRCQVTEAFALRAVQWQVYRRIGLGADGKLGVDALIYMGIDPGHDWGHWNADDLASGEADATLEEVFAHETFFTTALEVVTVDGEGKAFGDVTGDDGIAMGIAHYTSPAKCRNLLERMYDADSHLFMSAFFPDGWGEMTFDELAAELGLDAKAKDRAALLIMAQNDHVDGFMRLLQIPKFKQIQIDEWADSNVATAEKRAEGLAASDAEGKPVTIGTAALCLCLGNSSYNPWRKGGPAHAIAGTQHEMQNALGLDYATVKADSDKEGQVASMFFQRRFDALIVGAGTILSWVDARDIVLADELKATRDSHNVEAITDEKLRKKAQKGLDKALDKVREQVASAPPHRPNRLGLLVDKFAGVWDEPYTGAHKTDRGTGETESHVDVTKPDAGLGQTAGTAPAGAADTTGAELLPDVTTVELDLDSGDAGGSDTAGDVGTDPTEGELTGGQTLVFEESEVDVFAGEVDEYAGETETTAGDSIAPPVEAVGGAEAILAPVQDRYEEYRMLEKKRRTLEDPSTHEYRESKATHVELERQLTEAIAEARTKIAGLPSPTREQAFELLNDYTGFYAQSANATVISLGQDNQCNITAVSMCLQGLGKQPGDYGGDWSRLEAIAALFRDPLAERGETTDPHSMSLPDFIQLVAISTCAQGELSAETIVNEEFLDGVQSFIESGRKWEELVSGFGVDVNGKSHDLELELAAFGSVSGAAGVKCATRKGEERASDATSDAAQQMAESQEDVGAACAALLPDLDTLTAHIEAGESAEAQVVLEALLEKLATIPDQKLRKKVKEKLEMEAKTLENPKKALERVRKARGLLEDEVRELEAYRHAGSLEDMQALVSVEDYKDGFLGTVHTALGEGKQIVTHLAHHFVRLQSIAEDGPIVDDPGGRKGESIAIPWSEAIADGYFDRYYILS